MIKITRAEVGGFEPAIRGMRNPMNSWDRSDSLFDIDPWDLDGRTINDDFEQMPSKEWYNCSAQDYKLWIGPNDLDLMRRLAKAGTEHSKYRRMIVVYCDILAPLYWWKEFDTYKVGTVANSCSTMHKIAAKEFELDDFSHEHLIDSFEYSTDEGNNTVSFEYLDTYCLLDAGEADGFESPYLSGEIMPSDILNLSIAMLNRARKLYLETKDKKYWWQMIQLLPSSYNQKRTVMMNYEVLSRIYHQRKDHKLDEWHDFCSWIENLPYADALITMEDGDVK